MENLDSVACGAAEHSRKRQRRYSWQLASNTNRESFRMAGSVIRLKELVDYMGLSRSAIYERMDKNSPRYAEDFPKSFRLGGGAVGWYRSEIDAWLARCSGNQQSEIEPSKPEPSTHSKKSEAQRPTKPKVAPELPGAKSNHSLKPSSTATIISSPSPAKWSARPGNLAASIVEGGRINDRIHHHLQMKEWTPAMGAMLVSGIEPPLNSNEIPEDGIGLDDIELHRSNARFNEARRILRVWHDWKADTQDPILNIEPTRYLNWCIDEDVESDWLRLILELAGMDELGSVDLTPSRFALLTNR